ncbi:NAD(P)H-dependent oxidoreductase [Sphingobacterium siyangense]|uniref:Modulator of drug activity B n=1 Tax=Sphingobacterium siyangense TaxID=459529 RepID=A0A562MG09_9SPHI|nr:NAD(P)H-dependent oxidoreductase [Sphingobacterium siyangense]TWI18853.1 modulator of drug activity B [Sphingobacterium siyangense]
MAKKIFIINGGKAFAHSGGKLNKEIVEWDKTFFTPENSFEIQVTDLENEYDVETEIDKFLWADIIIYHFPVWWMYIPYTLKQYLDNVLTAGHRKGMYYSDGRKAENPKRGYGTGGLMTDKKYMVTTTWNAPEEAFTLPEEFFEGRSVDDGVLFAFHKMNAFCGMKSMESFHFHDVEKNIDEARFQDLKSQYLQHLTKWFN